MLFCPKSNQTFDQNNSKTLTPEDWYIDLYDFANKIKAHISNPTVQDAADSVMSAVDSYVIAEEHKDGMLVSGGSVQILDGSHGVSVHFPTQRTSFYDYTNYDFAFGAIWSRPQSALVQTQSGEVEWGPMLVAYFNETQPDGPDISEPPSPVSPLVPEGYPPQPVGGVTMKPILDTVRHFQFCVWRFLSWLRKGFHLPTP